MLVEHALEDSPEPRTGAVSQCQQIPATQQGLEPTALFAKCGQLGLAKIHGGEIARAGQRVDAGKFEQRMDVGRGKHPAERRALHFGRAAVTEMVADQPRRPILGREAPPQTPTHRPRERFADHFVAVKVDATVVSHARRLRFAGVVQQHPQRQSLVVARAIETREAAQRVGEDIALRVPARRLSDVAHGRDFGQHRRQEPRGREQFEGARGTSLEQDADDLLADPLPGDFGDVRCRDADGGECSGFDLGLEARGKAHGTQEPQPILAEALCRIANRPDHPRREIALTTDVVDDLAALRVEEHAVDREITPRGIAPGVTRAHRRRAASVKIRPVGAERRDLDLRPPGQHQHHPEARADRDGAGKEPLYLLGSRRRRDVPIARLDAEQAVADTTPRQQRHMAGLAQPTNDRARRSPARRIQTARRSLVLATLHPERLAPPEDRRNLHVAGAAGMWLPATAIAPQVSHLLGRRPPQHPARGSPQP